MPPVDGGDVPRVPRANVILSAANLQETQLRVDMADKLVKDGFDAAGVMKALSLPAIDHTSQTGA